MNKMNKIPQKFQGILWSRNIKSIDKEKDKAYIIHQVLMYGSLDQIRWLRKNYSLAEIKMIFLNQPRNIYTRAALNFVGEIILHINSKDLDEEKYLKNKVRSIK